MYLYHGTSAQRAAQMLREGIRPRSMTSMSNWKDHPSCETAVYLTNAYPVFFGNVAASEANEDEGAYLVIDTDRLDASLLAADEDAVEQAMRNLQDDPLEGRDMTERTKLLRDMLLQLRHQGFTWEWSLKALGNCTYHGIVPPEAIIKTVRWERQSPMSVACDPAMSLLNYMIMGGYYRKLSAILAGLPYSGETDVFQSQHTESAIDRLKSMVRVEDHFIGCIAK